MDWSRKHIGAVVLPPKGQLLYKQNLINPDLDHDTIAILQRNHNVLPFAILDSQSSIHSTQNQTQNAIKDNSAIQIQFLLWDFTGDFLLSLNNHNTILIWTMGETIQDWNIIQTIQLSDSPLSVSFYQQRPKYDVTYDLTDNIPILNYSTIGPSFLFGQLAINIVLSTGLFQTWYYNGEQVLSHLDYMLDDLLQDTLTHVDTFVHKQNTVRIGACSNSKVWFYELNIDLGSETLTKSFGFCLSLPSNILKSTHLTFLDQSHLIIVSEMANGQNSISLFKENMQFGWQFVTDAVVDQVTCIKSITRLNSLLGETSPFCVGFLDGTVEYRSVPTLQRVDLKDVLFPSMLKSVKTDGSINLDVKAKNFGSDGTENLFESEFFKGTKVENDLFNNAQEKSNRLDIDTKTDNIVGQRFPNLIPVCISSSPNGMYTMCLCVNAEGDSNRATIVVDSIYTEKAIIPEKRDQFYARAATILVTSFKKMFCMHDIVTFLKSLNEPIEFSQSLFNSVLSIQEKNFGIKNATSLNSGKSTDEQILMLQFFISRSLQEHSWLCKNSYLLIELYYVRDLFLRSLLNRYESINLIGEFIKTRSALSNFQIQNFKFETKSIHHIPPLCLWVLDLFGMLIRHLYRQSKMKETDIILEESPWMLILHRSSRYLLMEVLSLLKLFLQNLDVKEDPNETIPMKIVEGIYFRKLQSYLTSNRPSVDQLYSLFLAIDQSLSTLSPDLADQSERVLLTTAKVTETYLPYLKQIYTHLESHLPSLYKLSENGKADGMSQSIEMVFNQPSRIDFHNSVDLITKHNIRSGSRLLQCTRCRRKTQVDMETDRIIGAYQSEPSWGGSYQDYCFCGGHWLPCV